eukprot:TRINITY_DN4079_c0_g1_i2.p1 TRINITY_DN4079_c0_g1~~TRINITY_DN4079_c0_g1_i2.p1  ORF type:complete len:199 (+),score=25.69 TRINITY_DN4079_c0_g1_i2:152-748(+)
MWHLMLTVDLLKHAIPDPSALTPSYSQGSNLGSDKENKDSLQGTGEEFLATPVFIHTKLRDHDISPFSIMRLRKAVSQYFSSSSFSGIKSESLPENLIGSSDAPPTNADEMGLMGLNLFLLPPKVQDDYPQRTQYTSYISMLGQLRDQVLSMECRPFAKSVSERDWLRNSARIWEIVKKSPVIADYSRTLQSSGLFRR